MCHKCKAIVCSDSCLGTGQKKCTNCQREQIEFRPLPIRIEGIYKRVQINCPKCSKYTFTLRNELNHYKKKCRGLRYYTCNAPACAGIVDPPRYNTRKQLLEQHWVVDCPEFNTKCETCGCPAKFKNHDCIAELKLVLEKQQ